MPADAASSARRFPLSAPDLVKWGPLVALFLLMVIGTLVNSNFLSAANLTNVITRSAFIGIIAVGATFVITAGGIDLSVGAMTAFIAGVMIIIMNQLAGVMEPGLLLILIGMGVGLLLGAALGAVNGLVITLGKVDAFIVTLGTMGIFRSLVTFLADGGTLSLDFAVRDVYRPVYFGSFLGVPWPVWVLGAVAVIGTIMLTRTPFGRSCFAVGANDQAARYAAINVARVRLKVFILQGICVALATLVYVPRLGSASATTGLLWELEAITAVIVGGTVLKGGYGRVWGTVVGALILGVIGNILNLTDAVSPYLNGAFQGAIIIAAVLVQRGRTPR